MEKRVQKDLERCLTAGSCPGTSCSCWGQECVRCPAPEVQAGTQGRPRQILLLSDFFSTGILCGTEVSPYHTLEPQAMVENKSTSAVLKALIYFIPAQDGGNSA